MKRKESFLRTKDVIEKVQLSRATIWRLENEGLFPQRRRIGPHAVAWLESEVEDWMHSRKLAVETGDKKRDEQGR